MNKSLSERVRAAISPGPFCRDCADVPFEDHKTGFVPRCPSSGELCDPKLCADEIAEAVAELEKWISK